MACAGLDLGIIIINRIYKSFVDDGVFVYVRGVGSGKAHSSCKKSSEGDIGKIGIGGLRIFTTTPGAPYWELFNGDIFAIVKTGSPMFILEMSGSDFGVA